jgi:hypothetical protein
MSIIKYLLTFVMHRIIIVLILCVFAMSLSKLYASEWSGSIIKDPSISARCNSLIKKRQKQIVHKQKIYSLIERNKTLQNETPVSKVSIKRKLLNNLRKLNRELKLSKLKIKHYTEDVVRKGCPGISL